MSIFNHFKHLKLSTCQLTALEKLEIFFDNNNQVFILKGYAGTGKTTILKGVVEYLNSKKKSFTLMAPTGRAAKVLRDKTTFGKTIHSSIYDFENLIAVNKESEDEAEHSFHYLFPIKKDGGETKIIIVDESSMISSKESKNELFTFGTNILLNDLMTYAALKNTNNKIIFVGDPAQLPPYGDSESNALISSFFNNSGIKNEEFEMTEVKRQDNNLILKNATKVRELINSKSNSELKFDYDENTFIKSNSNDFIESYIQLFPKPEIGNGVIISHSNTQCYHYNNAIRERLFPNQNIITPGDLILINNNNYHTYGVEIFNGDIAKVVSVSEDLIPQTAPVYCDEGFVRVRKSITIYYRKISIVLQNHNEIIDCFINDSLLNSINKGLSICEMKSVYINFVMRFKENQNQRKEIGLPYYKVGSEEFKTALRTDSFYNALQVKYGYAITCHKAQGGEWNSVFVDYTGRVSLKNDPLRWCYTATTRAIKQIYTFNAPNFGKLDKFKTTQIGNIANIPIDALYLENVPLSPFHNQNQHKGKSLKYWEILEKLETTDYKIEKVESHGEYLERYYISNGSEQIQIQSSNKGSGHFITPFVVLNSVKLETKQEIERVFNSEYKANLSLEYKASSDFLEFMYSRMQNECINLDISITNVIESKNFVTYYLITDSVFSYLQFYYNGKNQFTTAMPKSLNINDNKLQTLITNLCQQVK